MATILQEGQHKIKRAWARAKKADRLMLVGLLVVVGLSALVALVLPEFVYHPSSAGVQNEGEASDSTMYRHPLTGEELLEPLAALPRVFGVMIDNHVDARPAAGIEQAFLVIEAPVEAGIPRFLAFFTEDQEVAQIGPVRSARPYFLDWNNELDAVYAHVGGSNAALDAIATGGTFDLNQYWWGEYFWRARDRYAPHNVFTSTRRMREFVELKGEVAPESLYGLWTFTDVEQAPRETASLHVAFDEPGYIVDWTYSEERNLFERLQSGQPHVAASGEQVRAENVAVVVTDIEVIDSVGRRRVRTIGEGEAWVLQNGRAIETVWRKPSASERLKFYDAVSGEELPMVGGATWIEVVGDPDDIVIQ